MKKSKRLGAYSGTERREPGTKSSRNQTITITRSNFPDKTNNRLGAFCGAQRLEPGANSSRNVQTKITPIKFCKFQKHIAWALTPAAKGVSQEPNVAEIKQSRLSSLRCNNSSKSKCLGAYSGAERRDERRAPGTNLTDIRTNQDYFA